MGKDNQYDLVCKRNKTFDVASFFIFHCCCKLQKLRWAQGREEGEWVHTGMTKH